jgi:hypothetical protein
MIGTIRRHNKLLWLLIVPATILSFLWYFLPSNARNGGMDRPSAGGDFGKVFGESVTAEQLHAARQEGRLLFRLNYQEWPDTEQQRKELDQIAAQRLLLNAELEQYHINVTADAAARYIRQLFGIKPTDNVPTEKIMEEVVKLAREGNVTLDDFDRFARHQAGQEYLIALVGMSGKLITPQEAEVFFRRENEPMQTELVTFPITNFYSQVNPTAKDLEDYYTKRQADYRIPERIQINYVELEYSNYLAKAEKLLGTNLNPQVDQQYLQAGPTAFKDESGVQLSAQAAKAKIKKQMLQYASQAEAIREASSFLNDLSQGHSDEHPYTPGDLAALAKTRNLTVKTSAPFDQKSGPKDLTLLPRDLHVLFSLRTDDPDDKERSLIYAPSPLKGEDAVYVAGLQKTLPSEIQPFSAVKDKVAADYRQSKALELARAAGARFQSALGDGLAQGKTFDTMCAAQFVRAQKLTPFSLTTPSIPEIPEKAEFEQLQTTAGRMHPGQCSPFIPTADGGFLLYVKAQMPVDEATVKSEMPAFLARMRERFQIAAFQTWFNKEAQAHLVMPPTADTAPGS